MKVRSHSLSRPLTTIRVFCCTIGKTYFPDLVSGKTKYLKLEVLSELKVEVTRLSIQLRSRDNLAVQVTLQFLYCVNWCWQAVLLLMVKAAQAPFSPSYEAPIVDAELCALGKDQLSGGFSNFWVGIRLQNANRASFQLSQRITEIPKHSDTSMLYIQSVMGDQRTCTAPQITGGSPGRGRGSSSSRSSNGLGGKNTVSRCFSLPFPFSFCVKESQHSEQISYSLPSISFC